MPRAKTIPETVVHGKESTYVYWGCRCEACSLVTREARQVRYTKEDWVEINQKAAVRRVNVERRTTQQRTEAARRLKAGRVGKPIPSTVVHGTESAYGNWSCRCEPCLDAGRTGRIERRIKADKRARGVEDMLFIDGPYKGKEMERPVGEKKMLVHEFAGVPGAVTKDGDVPIRSHLYERVEVMIYKGVQE